MSYLALARKWRPRSFAELVGQEHVRGALGNALTQGRVHHAFLFTGTRGVGKTTIARILAKCLNCETGVTATPCGICASCKEIDEGRFVDLIEVDAASRTKVDDTRELLDNVQYAPTRGRYKVYLIDEVHMLSTHSFNALLKTLEEPPPHVKFLLATTDPQKLPVTVLSRCLQFNLKRLPVALISEHLNKVLTAEKIAVRARGAAPRGAGGRRQHARCVVAARPAHRLRRRQGRAKPARAACSAPSIATTWHETRARARDRRCAQLLETARTLEEFSPDYAQVLDELAALLTRVALQQLVPDYEGDELFDPALVTELADAISAEDVQLYYQTAILGRRDLPLAPDPRTGFEMTLVRMLAFRPAGAAATARRCGGARVRPRASSAVRRRQSRPSCGRRPQVPSIRCSGRASSAISMSAARLASSQPIARWWSIAAIRCDSRSIRRSRARRHRSKDLRRRWRSISAGAVTARIRRRRAAGRNPGAARRTAFGRSARRGAAHARRRSHGARNEIAFRRDAASGIGAANGVMRRSAMRGGGNMMKQAMALQANMKKAQDEIANMEVIGESGGGMVKVTMNGKHEVKRVQIEPQVAAEDREMLEDLIAAAVNDAVNKVGAAVPGAHVAVMSGVALPPGFKLPF